MLRRHVVGQLSAFHHGELAADESRQVTEHLRDCSRCRKTYEEIKLGIQFAERLPELRVPDVIWTEIEARLYHGERASAAVELPPKAGRSELFRFKTNPSMALTATAVVVVLLGAALWFQHASRRLQGLEVSLDPYLGRIETSSALERISAISSAPQEFVASDRVRALKAAKVDHVVGIAPLAGSELLVQRIRSMGRFEVVQLVYGRGEETFSVFVAPEPVNFTFGKREIKETQIQGIRCRKVDCPRTTVVLFGAGGYHCALISKVTDLESISAVVRYFVSAHKDPGGGS